MAAVTICSDFGVQKNKVCHCFHCFPIYLPWSDGLDAMILVFWMLNKVELKVKDLKTWYWYRNFIITPESISRKKVKGGMGNWINEFRILMKQQIKWPHMCMLVFVNIMEDKYQCSVRTSLRLAVYLLSILKWIRKLWYIYTMEYYSAIKKNSFESVLMRWMKLE